MAHQDQEVRADALPAFRQAVGAVVRAVPEGRVIAYGTVALLAGRPGAARQVGAALRGLSSEDPAFPWHRVVNAQGGISTYKIGGGELQVALLRSEGVEVSDGRIDLARYRFDPGPDAAGFSLHRERR